MNSKNKPTISLIIPTYNRPDDLEKCLQSVRKQTFKKYEVIVVDDASTKNIKAIANKNKVKYIRHSKRMGQSIGKNDGAKIAKGEILVFVDDDCVADVNWFKAIVDGFNKSDSIGAVGGKIINLGKNKLLNIHTFPLWWFLFPFTKSTGRILLCGLITTNFDKDQYGFVDWISAGNMAIRKNVFKEVKGFDPNYLGHCAFEEPDICSRINQKKYKILFEPSALCIHKLSTAARKPQSSVRFSHKSNEIFFHLKYLNRLNLLKKIIGIIAFVLYHAWDTLIEFFGVLKSRFCMDDIRGKLDGIQRFQKV